jgi:hypothetical protein
MSLEELCGPICHAVYANLQGSKSKLCPFYHTVTENGKQIRRRGRIAQHDCNVRFHYLVPRFLNGKASIDKMVLICVGEHPHAPPPPRKIPPNVIKVYLEICRQYGLAGATARRIIASPMLPILLNGDINLTETHVSMTNLDALNHLIRKERLREHPLGTDILGVQSLMQRQLNDPYIRAVYQFDNGKFMVLLQFIEQSHILYNSRELFIDKTFKQTKCQELEFNAFDHVSNCVTTVARVFTDCDDINGYQQSFRLVFGQAEKDVSKGKRRIPWAHLAPTVDLTRKEVKAILVDEHSAQVKGLGKYFEQEYSELGHSAEWHIYRIVKVCQFHYGQTINALEKKKKVPTSIYLRFKLAANS